MLISTSFGFPVPEAAELLIPATNGRVQVNIVPAIVLVGLYENAVLPHMPGGVKELLNVGDGVTITTTLCELVQPFAVKV